MTFEKLRFPFTPPPTLPTASRTPEPVLSTDVSSKRAGDDSRAGQLVERLEELEQATVYLQNLVLIRSTGLGVSIDPSVDPELDIALARVYAVKEAPTAIDMKMYRELLLADMNILRVELSLDRKTSRLSVTSTQKTDIPLITRSFEKSLTEADTYRKRVPLLLRTLMSDEVIFQHWKSRLKEYPVLRKGRVSVREQAGKPEGFDRTKSDPTDTSEEVFTWMGGSLDNWETIYAHTFELLALPNSAEKSFDKVKEVLQEEDESSLRKISELFRSLESTFHEHTLRQQQDSLTNLVYPRLISEVGAFRFLLDRFESATKTLSPNPKGALTKLLRTVRDSGIQQSLDAGLTGFIKDKFPLDKKPLPEGQDASEGELTLAATLEWSLQESKRQKKRIQTSLQKIVERRQRETGDRIEVMKHLRLMSSYIGQIDSILSGGQQGSLLSQSRPASSSTLESTGETLSQLTEPLGVSLSFRGEDVDIIPSPFPALSDVVAGVFQRGGLEIVTEQDLRSESQETNGEENN